MRIGITATKTGTARKYYTVTIRLNDREISNLMGDPLLNNPKIDDEIYVKVDFTNIKNFKISLSTATDPESYKLTLVQTATKLTGAVALPVNKFGKQLFHTKLKTRSPISLAVKPKEIIADISNLKPEILTREQIERRMNNRRQVANNPANNSTVAQPVQTTSLDIDQVQRQVMANLVAMGMTVQDGKLGFGKNTEVQVAPRTAKKTVVLHRPEMLGALINSTENVDIVDNTGNLLVSC